MWFTPQSEQSQRTFRAASPWGIQMLFYGLSNQVESAAFNLLHLMVNQDGMLQSQVPMKVVYAIIPKLNESDCFHFATMLTGSVPAPASSSKLQRQRGNLVSPLTQLLQPFGHDGRVLTRVEIGALSGGSSWMHIACEMYGLTSVFFLQQTTNYGPG